MNGKARSPRDGQASSAAWVRQPGPGGCEAPNLRPSEWPKSRPRTGGGLDQPMASEGRQPRERLPWESPINGTARRLSILPSSLASGALGAIRTSPAGRSVPISAGSPSGQGTGIITRPSLVRIQRPQQARHPLPLPIGDDRCQSREAVELRRAGRMAATSAVRFRTRDPIPARKPLLPIRGLVYAERGPFAAGGGSVIPGRAAAGEWVRS